MRASGCGTSRPSRPGKARELGTTRGNSLGAAMNDLLVVGLTIVIFAVFFLIVRAVEHIER
jgi:hypothetical protein